MGNYKIKISSNDKGEYAIAGHVGIGHVHSHSSYVQDDSVGFAVVSYLMREVLRVDTRIKSVEADIKTGNIKVTTYTNGVGESFSSRGITPIEVSMLEKAINEDGIYSQNVAIKVFGRMYGQGVTTVPVALQGAIALAVLDSFCKCSSNVHYTNRKYEGLIDKMAAIVVDINDIPVSLLLTINGNEGGIGPNEDNEGNTTYGPKGALMKKLDMDKVPTIIVESKAYIPTLSRGINKSTYLIRAQSGIDNISLAKRMIDSAGKLKLSYQFLDNALPRIKGQLKKATIDFADNIIELAENLKAAESSQKKVEILSKLTRLVSEDAGGVTFMSNEIHEEVRAAGIVPGLSSILSMIVSEEYIKYWKIPMLEKEELLGYIDIIVNSLVDNY